MSALSTLGKYRYGFDIEEVQFALVVLVLVQVQEEEYKSAKRHLKSFTWCDAYNLYKSALIKYRSCYLTCIYT